MVCRSKPKTKGINWQFGLDSNALSLSSENDRIRIIPTSIRTKTSKISFGEMPLITITFDLPLIAFELKVFFQKTRSNQSKKTAPSGLVFKATVFTCNAQDLTLSYASNNFTPLGYKCDAVSCGTSQCNLQLSQLRPSQPRAFGAPLRALAKTRPRGVVRQLPRSTQVVRLNSRKKKFCLSVE